METEEATDAFMQLLPTVVGDTNVANIIRMFVERAQFGLRKYGGKSTDRTDLSEDEWCLHAQLELMDGAVYLQKVRTTKPEVLIAVKGGVVCYVHASSDMRCEVLDYDNLEHDPANAEGFARRKYLEAMRDRLPVNVY